MNSYDAPAEKIKGTSHQHDSDDFTLSPTLSNKWQRMNMSCNSPAKGDHLCCENKEGNTFFNTPFSFSSSEDPSVKTNAC